MSADHLDGIPTPDSPEDNPNEKLGVDHNPTGPWANIKEKDVQDAILSMAGSFHKSCIEDNPTYSKFADFLDVFARAWLEQKAQVEREAQKYGFIPCRNTREIPMEDRNKAAILCLTLYGSFVLLGNGCLGRMGGSGQYEKIPLRKNGDSSKVRSPSGVRVSGAAKLHERLYMRNQGSFAFKSEVSALQALYYTTEKLPDTNVLALGAALSDSIASFSQTIRFSVGDTLPVKALPDHGEKTHPEYAPEKLPEHQPV